MFRFREINEVREARVRHNNQGTNGLYFDVVEVDPVTGIPMFRDAGFRKVTEVIPDDRIPKFN